MSEAVKSQLDNFRTIEVSTGKTAYGFFCDGFIRDDKGVVKSIPLSSLSSDMKKMIMNLINGKDVFDGMDK